MLLAGQKVYVGPFLKKADRPMDREHHFTNVYVKNLPDSVDDDKLNEIFSEHGSVTSAIVMKVFSPHLLSFCYASHARPTDHFPSIATRAIPAGAGADQGDVSPQMLHGLLK